MTATLLNADFSTESLTRGLNAAAVSLGPTSKSGIFIERSVSTTDINIEQIANTLTLVQSSPRGGVGDIHGHTSRSMVKLRIPFLKTSSTLLADSWQGRAGFGLNGAPASIEQELKRVQGEFRTRLEGTLDYMRTRALGGVILDADGSEIIDLWSEFGVVQQVVECALATSTTNVPNKIIAARRLSELELGMASAASWVAFCDAQFIDALRSSPSVEAGLANWAAASMMLADHRAGDLVVGGVKFIEVPNRAGHTYIPAGTAYLCPEGVPDLMFTAFAPPDWVECVNQLGLPMNMKAEVMDFNRGYNLEAISCPLSVCSRPRAIIKLNA